MKIGKLYITGLGKPLEITNEQAKKAERIINNEDDPEYGHLTDESSVQIGEVWSGKKKDMRYVAFEDVKQYRNLEENPTRNRYSKEQLREFESEIEPYLIKEGDSEYQRIYNGLVDDISNYNEKQPKLSPRINEIVTSLNLPEKSLDEIKVEAKKIMKQFYIGSLTRKNEDRFYQDRGVAKFNDYGELSVVEMGGGFPYFELARKVAEYRDWKSKIEFAKNSELDQLQEISDNNFNEGQQDDFAQQF